jgi:hypothetical protein
MANFISLSARKGDTYKGAVYSISLSGTPLDLTGASIKYQLKRNACEDPAFEFTDITISNPLSGEFIVEPVIIDITARQYLYDIEITTADSMVRSVVEGTFHIIQDISR